VPQDVEGAVADQRFDRGLSAFSSDMVSPLQAPV
jgi:hypothetical protein